MRSLCTALAFLTILTSACSSTEGEGTVVVNAYGESFIEEGIAADEMDDGWEIEFSTFLVSVEDVQVGGEELQPLLSVDLSVASEGEGHELGHLSLPAGDYAEPSYAITRVIVKGEGQKDGVTKSFDWDFQARTNYDECETTTSVSEGETSTFQITVHADHLFYDSLVAEEPSLFFGPLAAADENDDDEISQAELEAAGLGSYDAGSSGAIDNLWDFLNAQVATLGHVDGEGHCHAHVED